MPSAAGIIIATGVMTVANDALTGDRPLSEAADNIQWKVIPATLVAGGIFYALEQANSGLAKGLAWLAFLTAFVGGDTLSRPELTGGKKTSPLGTLMEVFGYSYEYKSGVFKPGSQIVEQGIPYQAR